MEKGINIIHKRKREGEEEGERDQGGKRFDSK